MISITYFLLVVAFICACCAALSVPTRRVNLLALAIALWLLAVYVLPGLHR